MTLTRNHASADAWTRAGLESKGFGGFVTFGQLPTAGVPKSAGVYVVYRDAAEPPTFRDVSVAGWFKDKDPSVSSATLAAAWVPGSRVLNIGKASIGVSKRRGLSKRLNEYRKFGEGHAVGHRGGRYIWQLVDSSELLVAWMETPAEDPGAVEGRLIAEFRRHYGKRPFANLNDGDRPAR
jgi:hypothetical protein